MPELLQEMYYGPNVQNLIESDDCKVMRLSDNSGEGMMTLYHVFPGVFLMYNDFHMKECVSGFQTDMDLLCIDHCREGRIEQTDNQYASKCILYGAEGMKKEEFTDTTTQKGFTYEIEETIRCVRAKKTESPVVPHATTIACAELFDQIQAAKKE